MNLNISRKFGQTGVKDVSQYPMKNAGFLGAERNLLTNKGWSYKNGFGKK